MKKYFLFLGIAAFFLAALPSASVKAQMLVPKTLTTTSYGNALDTVVNTAAKVTTPADGLIKNWKNGITAVSIVKAISGTVGGTLALQGSMDGTEWVTIGTAATPSNSSANYTFNTTVRYYYYRISYTGTGTMSASIKSQIYTY